MKKLFFTAFLQVFLVSANTYFISQTMFIGIAICGFMISYLWTLNVQKISIASKRERIIYSSGAMLGGLSGVWVVSELIKIF
jgi:hypothetical protein